jgi:hypothetical protein
MVSTNCRITILGRLAVLASKPEQIALVHEVDAPEANLEREQYSLNAPFDAAVKGWIKPSSVRRDQQYSRRPPACEWKKPF